MQISTTESRDIDPVAQLGWQNCEKWGVLMVVLRSMTVSAQCPSMYDHEHYRASCSSLF